MRNTRLRRHRSASAFRRIAAVAWDAPREPNMYGTVMVRADPLLAWLEAHNARQDGPKVTVSHCVARAVAMTLGRHPDANAMVRWGRLYLREDVDLFLEVLVPPPEGAGVGEADLHGVTVRQADRKTVDAIAQEVAAAADRIRGGADPDFERTRAEARLLPAPVMRRALRLVEFLQYGLNLDTSILGAARDPFGSAHVSNVGSMGLRVGYSPLFPLARAPIVIVVGEVHEAVAPVDGAPAIIRQLPLNATCDHRVVDGYHMAVMAKEVQALLENPERLGA